MKTTKKFSRQARWERFVYVLAKLCDMTEEIASLAKAEPQLFENPVRGRKPKRRRRATT
jgi:hypothetical protein